MHLHVTLRGLSPATAPRSAGPFVFNDEHGIHLYSGRPMTSEEFNAFASSREWSRMIDLHGPLLQVRAVEKPAEPKDTRLTKEKR